MVARLGNGWIPSRLSISLILSAPQNLCSTRSATIRNIVDSDTLLVPVLGLLVLSLRPQGNRIRNAVALHDALFINNVRVARMAGAESKRDIEESCAGVRHGMLHEGVQLLTSRLRSQIIKKMSNNGPATDTKPTNRVPSTMTTATKSSRPLQLICRVSRRQSEGLTSSSSSLRKSTSERCRQVAESARRTQVSSAILPSARKRSKSCPVMGPTFSSPVS